VGSASEGRIRQPSQFDNVSKKTKTALAKQVTESTSKYQNIKSTTNLAIANRSRSASHNNATLAL